MISDLALEDVIEHFSCLHAIPFKYHTRYIIQVGPHLQVHTLH